MSYYGYHAAPPPPDNSPFRNGFSGCLGMGCAAVVCIVIGSILMMGFLTVMVLNS